MIALEGNTRNHLILTLLYAAGLRVSELCALKVNDLQARDGGAGQVTVFGKGSKTNVILLPSSVWNQLLPHVEGRELGCPLFVSRKGGHLTRSAVMRIVRKAAKRAGIPKNVSPHFLRHSHATHALARNAPISLVQATLGHSSLSTTGRYLHARPTDSSSRYLPL